MTDTTLFLPPEWAPQSALWVGWPRLAEEWGGDLTAARSEIAASKHTLKMYLTQFMCIICKKE